MNETFDWDAAMQRASGEDSTFSKVTLEMKTFILSYTPSMPLFIDVRGIPLKISYLY